MLPFYDDQYDFKRRKFQIMAHSQCPIPRLWQIQVPIKCVQNSMEICISLSLCVWAVWTPEQNSRKAIFIGLCLSVFQCKYTITPTLFSRSVSCSVDVPKGLQFISKWNQSTANVLNFSSEFTMNTKQTERLSFFTWGFGTDSFATASLCERINSTH